MIDDELRDRAEKIARDWLHSGYLSPDALDLVKAIESALRAVREETIELCADVCDRWAEDTGDSILKIASGIAEEIRDLGKPRKKDE